MKQEKVYGYARVSSKNQFEDRQLLAMKEYAIVPRNLYVDHQSGKDFERPAYQKLLRKLKQGDLLVVKSIDRLGRNYQEIIEQWRTITKARGIDIVVIDMPLLDTRRNKDLLGTLISDLVLQILSFVAENERDLIRQRQEEGILAAKKRGVKFGRPRKTIQEEEGGIFERWRSQEISAKEASDTLGVSIRTLYRHWKLWEDDTCSGTSVISE